MEPKCSVSWTSLKILSLDSCFLDEESFAKILSGSPILETLILSFCDEPRVLDLSKSMRLKTLVIDSDSWVEVPTHIVAPHIHCLSLRNYQSPCTFVDVSSLTQAKLDFCFDDSPYRLKADFLQGMALQKLDKLQNVDKLIFGENFLKILSLARAPWCSFSEFKAKALTLETTISQYVTSGIVRLLQNSPHLKKLTLVHTVARNIIPKKHLDYYLDSHGLSPDQCWVFGITSPLDSKHVVSLMKIMLKNTKALEKMLILRLKGYLEGRDFEELLQIVPLLSYDNNVSIVLS